MKEQLQQLIDLEKQYGELSVEQFKGKVTRENIKDVVIKKAERVRSIMNETNSIIAQHIEPYLKNPGLITAEIANDFDELASQLSSHSVHIDTGLAYQLREALATYAKNIGDDELYIKSLFFKGLALFFLDSKLFRPESLACYREICSYSHRYESFSEPIRNIIVRAFGNVYVCVIKAEPSLFLQAIDQAVEFWRGTAMKIDPQFPWEKYFLNVDENVCTVYIPALREDAVLEPELLERVYQSALSMYKNARRLAGDNPYITNPAKVDYFLTAIEFYTNRITNDECCERIEAIYRVSKPDEYTADNMYRKLHITAVLLFHLTKYPSDKMTDEDRHKKISDIEKDVFSYIENVPASLSSNFVSTMFESFASGSTKAYKGYEFLRVVLTLTVLRHMPTFVHSVMVARLAVVISKYMIENAPEYFVGMPEVSSVNDVIEKQGKIIELAWYGGLSHDIGKISYSSTVSLYGRKLIDEEFSIIKQHPHKTCHFFATSEEQSKDKHPEKAKALLNLDESLISVSEIALGHHKSYDGKRGYPVDFDNTKSLIKPFIDIVSIADATDAATDVVGRSYAVGKNLDTLVGELVNGAGTQYSPIIVRELAKKDELYRQIEQVLAVYRYDLYYQCYTGIKVSEILKTQK